MEMVRVLDMDIENVANVLLAVEIAAAVSDVSFEEAYIA